MCGAGGGYGEANQLDIDQAYIQELELKGLLANLEGKPEQAERWLRQATDLEDNVSYSYGPPEVVKPSYELYGEWLLGQERPEDALQQFDRALKRGPKRVQALNGKLDAARALGREQAAGEVQRTLDEIKDKAAEQQQTQLSQLQ